MQSANALFFWFKLVYFSEPTQSAYFLKYFPVYATHSISCNIFPVYATQSACFLKYFPVYAWGCQEEDEILRINFLLKKRHPKRKETNIGKHTHWAATNSQHFIDPIIYAVQELRLKFYISTLNCSRTILNVVYLSIQQFSFQLFMHPFFVCKT